MGIVIQTELVTPEALVLSEEFMLVTAPGVDGYFGVMSGHTPFVTLLTAGVLSAGAGDEDAKQFVISGGFAEVRPDKVTILTERALPREQITKQLVANEKHEAETKLAHAEGAQEATLIAYWKARMDFVRVCQELLKKEQG
ncbi:MAG: ATP synthase F1 subunit epsilon [Magnetococcales bacterium]|nr:ATP synthase F1 subunit epsilon [Magnetococcales bacterium]